MQTGTADRHVWPGAIPVMALERKGNKQNWSIGCPDLDVLSAGTRRWSPSLLGLFITVTIHGVPRPAEAGLGIVFERGW